MGFFGDVLGAVGSAIGGTVDSAIDAVSSAGKAVSKSVFQTVFSPFAAVQGQIMVARGMTEAVTAQVRAFAQVVPRAWKGGDEQAFVQEVNQVLVPQLNSMFGSISGMGSNFGAALDIVKQAGQQAKSLVGEIESLVDAI